MPRTKWLHLAVRPLRIATVLLALSCVPLQRPEAPAPRPTALGERAFTAVLYPYIPDSGNDRFASLIAALEDEFETANPEIDLQLTMNPELNLYDFDKLATLLGTGSGSVNMVELDTILLGDLVQKNLLQPLPFGIGDLGLLPAALEAAKVSSTTYGVPTYLCGNFIYSWDEKIRDVHSGQGLIQFLKEHPDPTTTPLIGNFMGSWTLPSLYVDAWADTHTNDSARVATSYSLPLDQATMDIFSRVVDLCGASGGPCLSGVYKDNNEAEVRFAQNKANGFVGYSERLFYILQARGGDVTLTSVISAPLGVNSNPVMFVDALVLNRACTGQCALDAETFSRFMSSFKVRTLIAFSNDVSPETYPRYLLQAVASFYTSPPGSQNLIYQQLYPFVQESQPFPNEGFPRARAALNEALQKWLDGGLVDAVPSPVGQRVDGVEIRRAPTRFPDVPER